MSERKQLLIRWQRLLMDGATCPRCGSTEAEVEKATAALGRSLSPLGIDVVLEKGELSVKEFKQDTLQSNRIWLNGRLLEEWIGGATGQSECCDVCGPSDCRTVSVGDEVYETIPAEIIVKAGLLAGAELLGQDAGGCCPIVSRPSDDCCP